MSSGPGLHAICGHPFLKNFARAIHCLAKLGDEVTIRAQKDKLIFSTVSASRSAYGTFTFYPNFFDEYEVILPAKDASSKTDSLECKVLLKSCLHIFHSIPALEKSVEKCKISLRPVECRLIFQFSCRLGIYKTYSLFFQDGDAISTPYGRNPDSNFIQVRSKLLTDFMGSFQPGLEEVTLQASKERVRLRSYIDDLRRELGKGLRTELCIDPDEFEQLSIVHASDVTFCLKEFKAILQFCDSMGLLLNINFEQPGQPIVFYPSGDHSFDADFLLATLQEDGDVIMKEEPTTATRSERLLASTQATQQSQAGPSSRRQTQTQSTPADSAPHRVLRSDTSMLEHTPMGPEASLPSSVSRVAKINQLASPAVFQGTRVIPSTAPSEPPFSPSASAGVMPSIGRSQLSVGGPEWSTPAAQHESVRFGESAAPSAHRDSGDEDSEAVEMTPPRSNNKRPRSIFRREADDDDDDETDDDYRPPKILAADSDDDMN
eukprot:Colp12_sorted_trinity150504_noHs@36439